MSKMKIDDSVVLQFSAKWPWSRSSPPKMPLVLLRSGAHQQTNGAVAHFGGRDRWCNGPLVAEALGRDFPGRISLKVALSCSN